ncbi:ead/Ea22-like family protein [Escherichia coli]|nr:ead/Ea22-like family protein [Escherichia coli]EIY0427424.1 ead/Ea22-like family protein [Escherichia coli]EJA8043587.1 ead/Ea22-like family protein [Escherichia coli]EJD2318283.1 ead/Ea22-like family protein [Escherichia coli]EKK1372220.1 ead/Ea22-like family protein [Escherichia coli]
MSEINYLALRERYSPKPAPRCSVCGEEMSIQRISGAHVVYACSGYGDDGDFKTGRTLADEHYEKSRVTVVDDNDPDVIALLEELDKRRHYIGRLEQENVEMALTLEKLRVEMKAAKKRIAELEAEPVSQTYKLNELSGNSPGTPDSWISCSERMPEETGDIIVVSDGIVMSGISYSRRDGFYMAALEYDDDEPIDGVTHWMPLPEPPQG